MTQFTKDDVQYFANFARIAVSDKDAELFAEQLGELIKKTADLSSVDTDQVEPMTTPIKQINVLREDTPQDVLDREDMLKSVKEHVDGLIKVPNIL